MFRVNLLLMFRKPFFSRFSIDDWSWQKFGGNDISYVAESSNSLPSPISKSCMQISVRNLLILEWQAEFEKITGEHYHYSAHQTLIVAKYDRSEKLLTCSSLHWFITKESDNYRLYKSHIVKIDESERKIMSIATQWVCFWCHYFGETKRCFWFFCSELFAYVFVPKQHIYVITLEPFQVWAELLPPAFEPFDKLCGSPSIGANMRILLRVRSRLKGQIKPGIRREKNRIGFAFVGVFARGIEGIAIYSQKKLKY